MESEESFKESSLNFCIFCYENKGFRTGNLVPVGEKVTLSRFLDLLGRYVEKRFNIEPLFYHLKDAEPVLTSSLINACQECVQMLSEFCKLYEQMEQICFKLEWCLRKLVNKMELAGQLPLSLDLSRKVVKEDELLHNLKRFRKVVMEKCNSKIAKSQPKVILKRLQVPQPASGNCSKSEVTVARSHENIKYPLGSLLLAETTVARLNDDREEDSKCLFEATVPEMAMGRHHFGEDDNDNNEYEHHSEEEKFFPGENGSVSESFRDIAQSSGSQERKKKDANSSFSRVSLRTNKTVVFLYSCREEVEDATNDFDVSSSAKTEAHKSKSTGNQVFRCVLCAKNFSRKYKNNVIRHLRNEHSMSLQAAKNVFLTKINNKRSEEEEFLNETHNEIPDGSLLNVESRQINIMKKHKENKEEEVDVNAYKPFVKDPTEKTSDIFKKVFSCTECYKTFKIQKGLNFHMSKYHSKETANRAQKSNKRIHTCRHCRRIFSFKQNLNRHLRVRHNDGPKKNTGKSHLLDQIKMDRFKESEIITPGETQGVGDCKDKMTIAPKAHSKGGKKIPKINCPYCYARFMFKKNLCKHVKKYHEDKVDQLKHDLLSSELPKEQLGRKRRKDLQDISKSTPEQELMFDGMTELKEHILCPVNCCGESFLLESDYERHKKLHGSFQCQFCEAVKDYAPDLSAHELEHHLPSNPLAGGAKSLEDTQANAKYYQCARCEYKSLKRWKCIHHHVEAHLGLTIKIGSCDICLASFSSLEGNTEYRQHFKSHHDKTGVNPGTIKKCDQCPGYFLKMRQLILHKRNIHQVNLLQKESRNKCPECGKSFSSFSAVKLHMKTKHKFDDESPSLPFPCEVSGCKKRFSCREEMEHHVGFYRHNELKESIKKEPVVFCHLCNLQCKGTTGLNIHMKSHKRPLEYICEQCGLGFKTKTILKRHYLFHKPPEEWEYQCESCGKKCQTKHKLADHYLTHTGAKPHECKVCGRKYTKRDKLRHHINSKHKDDGVQDIARKKAKPKFISRREKINLEYNE